MKKFTINCDFSGQMSPFNVYVGKPEHEHHPLHFQADWLTKNRGGTIPNEVMDAVAQLKELADKNNVSLEELCIYALGTKKQQEELDAQEDSVTELGQNNESTSANNIDNAELSTDTAKTDSKN